ncbi:MAG: NUDIX hydrolase [Nitrospirae bacterium]|nr:NUDIX hydrolase [Nitrospirota bacterium]
MSVISKKTLWEGKFLRSVLIKYNVRCNSSHSVEARNWEAFERVNCDGVIGIVPFTDSDEVILIRQFRPPLDGFVIELPAGLVDSGEKFEQAVRRELIEETGYEAGDVQFLAEGPMSSGASSEILSVYVATGLRHVGIGQRDETEDIEVIPVHFNDVIAKLEELRQSGNYIDLKVYGMIEMAKKFLKDKRDKSHEKG